MFLTLDTNTKTEILLPQPQLKFIFMHSPVPKSNDPLDN